MNFSKIFASIFFTLLLICNSYGKEQIYNLVIDKKTVNFANKTITDALAINGSIPAPTLRFRLGDIAVINVTNKLKVPSTLHWHGILVPWDQDGPSFYNSKIIRPGQTRTYRFPVKHVGTYWYHSHTEFQEQRGLYGAIVIEDNDNQYQVDHDIEVVMSDWTNEKPKDVLKNLKKDGDYYAFKKKFFPSILDAVNRGAFFDYLKGEWTRMGPMDLGDIGYDAFLINGKRKNNFMSIKPGEKVRLRLINAGASSYFYVNLGMLKYFQVIAKDGVRVNPVMVNEILMGVGETYDILFTMPTSHKALELRATAQDITGYASLILGHGDIENVPDKLTPNPYVMDHGTGHGGGNHGGGNHGGGNHGGGNHGGGNHGGGNHGGGNHGGGNHDLNELSVKPGMPMKTNRLNYGMLKSPKKTTLPINAPRRTIYLKLGGDMHRYTWHMNGKPFSKEMYINIKKGEVVRIIMENSTMMHHPMHLHGHFFRLLNRQNEYSPLFHTVDVGPKATTTIEFYANEPGIWFFHCHNLYHMKMGMTRLIKYEGFELPQVLKNEKKEFSHMITKDDDVFVGGSTSVWGAENAGRANLEIQVKKGDWEVDIDVEMTYDEYKRLDDAEAEILFKRYLSRYMAIVVGGEYEDKEARALLGLIYTLPMRVEASMTISLDGKFRVRLKKVIPLAKRLDLEIEPGVVYQDKWNFEFETKLMYRLNDKWSAGLIYDYDGRDDEHFFGFGFSVKF